jgi:hypothetical protein
MQLLRIQLVLKGIITQNDWEEINYAINFSFNKDSYFTDLKDAEILSARMELAVQMEPMIGKYFSSMYIKKNILKQSDEEIEQLNKEMAIDIARQQQEQMMQMQMAQEQGQPEQ